MCSPPGLAAPHRHNFFSLDFIKSKWKCLHRPVTSLISKHRLIVGWSRVWGCQLYPRCGPQGQTVSGTGRARGELRSPSVPTRCPRARALHSRPHWAAQPQPRTRCLFVASTQAPEQLHKGALPHIGHSIARYSHPCVTASLTAPLVHLRGHALIHALGKTLLLPQALLDSLVQSPSTGSFSRAALRPSGSRSALTARAWLHFCPSTLAHLSP